MITEIKIPQIGTLDEKVTLVEWLVKDNSFVKEGQPIFSIETSKVLFETVAPREGYLKIGEKCPQEIRIQSVVGWILDSLDEKISPISKTEKKSDRIRATDKARALADTLGIKLEDIPHKGIIKEKDVRSYTDIASSEKHKAKPAEGLPHDVDKDLIGQMVDMSVIQKRISEKVKQSLINNASAYLSIEVNAGKALEKLKEMTSSTKRVIRLNDMIIKASSYALENFPLLNAFCWEDKIIFYKSININIIMDYEGGLISPIIRDVNKKTVEEIAFESSILQMKALKKELVPADLCEGTFTVTNLSSFGIRNFVPIINGHQSAILAVTSEKDTCILGLSYDHRIINGIIGAKFLNSIKKYIESFEI